MSYGVNGEPTTRLLWITVVDDWRHTCTTTNDKKETGKALHVGIPRSAFTTYDCPEPGYLYLNIQLFGIWANG